MNVNLDLKRKRDTKIVLFYKQKIILLENQNSFLLNQNIFLQHQVDRQNNQIVFKTLNNSQVESNLQKSNNNLQKFGEKKPLFEVVQENISELPKGIKIPQKQN